MVKWWVKCLLVAVLGGLIFPCGENRASEENVDGDGRESAVVASQACDFVYEKSDDGIIIIGLAVNYVKKIIIPAEIEGTSVVTIGEMAFEEEVLLRSVSIPDSVTRIERWAFHRYDNLTSVELSKNVSVIDSTSFSECTRLTDIHVAPENPHYKDIDGVLFTKDGKTLLTYPAGKKNKTYKIPSGVVAIGDGAFLGSQNLRLITIPKNVTESTDYVLWYHFDGEHIYIPTGRSKD